MTLNRARCAGRPAGLVGPALFMAGLVTGLVLRRRRHDARCRRRMELLSEDLTEHLDEVCARVRDLGRRLGVYPDPPGAVVPDLSAEASEAETRADREERGEVDPLPGQRASATPQTGDSAPKGDQVG